MSGLFTTRLLAFCELDPFGTSMLICCIKKQCRVGYQAGKQFFTHDNFIKRDTLALFTHRYSASCVYNGLCNAHRWWRSGCRRFHEDNEEDDIWVLEIERCSDLRRDPKWVVGLGWCYSRGIFVCRIKTKNPSGKCALVNLCVCLALYYNLDIVVYFYYVE